MPTNNSVPTDRNSKQNPSSSTARLIAVQPKWQADDFFTEDAFRGWMREQFQRSSQYFHPTLPNLLVLTEFNGLPLMLLEKSHIARLGTFERVLAALALTQPRAWQFMMREKISIARALGLLHIERNMRLYLRTISHLAREYGVTVCTGSAPMARLFWQNGKIGRERGILTNTSVLFSETGELIGTTDKVFLTELEGKNGLDLTAGQLSEVRVFETNVGRVGIAISLDAFRDEFRVRLQQNHCQIMLQPDANGVPWSGQEVGSGTDQPQAWLNSSWIATNSGHFAYAVNPMVVGNLLNISFDGQSSITSKVEDTAEKSYILTETREGFLALADWVLPHESTREALQQRGRDLSAGSGSPYENAYHTQIIWADINLTRASLALHEPTSHHSLLPHEKALKHWIESGFSPWESHAEPKIS